MDMRITILSEVRAATFATPDEWQEEYAEVIALPDHLMGRAIRVIVDSPKPAYDSRPPLPPANFGPFQGVGEP